MPIFRASTAQSTEPDRLRPYRFHGLDFAVGPTHAVADCPFCGREKFSVQVSTGLGRCFRCGTGTDAAGFNGLVFTRKLYENAAQANVGNRRAFLVAVAVDRRLLSPATVAAWGVAQAMDGAWLVPGYGADGRLDQVYRRLRSGGAWVLMPTPGIWPEGQAHALHLPAGDFDPARENIICCEGPWDGMALWEVWDREDTGTNIVAVPGCTTWRDEWTEMCRGKVVTLMFDSDHPQEYAPGSGRYRRSGYDGMARVAKRLSGVASQVRWLKWGPEGYDAGRPNGWDVRDHLCGS